MVVHENLSACAVVSASEDHHRLTEHQSSGDVASLLALRRHEDVLRGEDGFDVLIVSSGAPFDGVNVASKTSSKKKFLEIWQVLVPYVVIFVCQFLVFALFFMTYYLARGFAMWTHSDLAGVAMKHTEKLIELEKFLGIYVEMDIADAVSRTPAAFRYFLSYFYLICHFSVTPVFYTWIVFFRPKAFPFFMTGFWVCSLVAAVTYVVFPAAPPRFFEGFTDILSDLDLDPHHSSVQALANSYASVPSLHFGWALVVGAGMIWNTRENSAIVKYPCWVIGAVYPTFMLFVIVGTSNHFWMDALAGGISILIGYVFAYVGFYRYGWKERTATTVLWNVEPENVKKWMSTWKPMRCDKSKPKDSASSNYHKLALRHTSMFDAENAL